MLIAFFIYLIVGSAVLAVCFENAPLYKDGKFIYKEWYTIFGIKIKRNK
jgi:hypothetical protein